MTDTPVSKPTPDAPPATSRRVLVGRVLGAHGLRGDVRIESWTEPRTTIFRYQPWVLVDERGVERELRGARGQESGKSLLARLPGIEDRDAAEAMRGVEIHVPREALPPPQPGEFYWIDLEGLRVQTVEGVSLGTVSHLFATGANDVLVARDDVRERLIPFVRPQYVTSVDFDAGIVTVDWDPDF